MRVINNDQLTFHMYKLISTAYGQNPVFRFMSKFGRDWAKNVMGNSKCNMNGTLQQSLNKPGDSLLKGLHWKVVVQLMKIFIQ